MTKLDLRPSSGEEARHRPDVGRLRRSLDAYMKRHGLRSTEQRRHIVDVLFQSQGHVSVEELLAQVKRADARIGYATVYRTLKMLTESGVASGRQFGDGHTRYELTDEETHHDHLICVACGRIVEFEAPDIDALELGIAQKYGFAVRYHRHEIYGVCQQCQVVGGSKAPTR